MTIPGALDVLRAVEVFLDGGEGEEVLRVGLARDLDLPQHVPLRRPPQHRAQQTLQGTLHDVQALIYFHTIKIERCDNDSDDSCFVPTSWAALEKYWAARWLVGRVFVSLLSDLVT